MYEQRCAAGRACGEVVDRLHAADVARQLGELEQADRLRQAAARWAAGHQYGAFGTQVRNGEQVAS